MRAGEYIGSDDRLRGCHALLMLPRDDLPLDHVGRPRRLVAGCVLAQFTSVPRELGDPACLQSSGPEPAADDLRFGWHQFFASEFRFEENV